MTAPSPRGFVLAVALAGLLLVAIGALRLAAGQVDPASPYSTRTIAVVYSIMILFGAGFLVFAAHWAFFR